MKSRLVILLLLISFTASAQVHFIAHRGASFDAPENTVASAELAWEKGADAVEIDIYLSKDNRVIVTHDENTIRTTGESHIISETNSDVLRHLDNGSWKDSKYAGEKLPFVEEIIETVPNEKTLVVEVKCGSEVLPALKDAIDQSGKISQIVFIGFGWQTILDTKQMFPDNACYWLASTKNELKAKIDLPEMANLDGINLYSTSVDAEIMEMAKSKGLDVLVWTVDDPEEAKRVANLGVSGITTNRPQWLKEQMN